MNNLEISLLIKKHWNIDSNKIESIKHGVSTRNWMIKVGKLVYIFRNAGTHKYYVDYQIYLLQELVKKRFPYNIPHPIKSKELFYIKSGRFYYYFYKYIKYTNINDFFTSKQVTDLAKMVADFHTIAANIVYPIKLRRKNIFDLNNIQKKLLKNFQISSKNKNKNYFDDLLIKNYKVLEHAIGIIKKTEIQKYRSLPKTTCYSDWNKGNILVNERKEIVGLVDYGGIFQEPRVFDIQNAIKNILVGETSFIRVKRFIDSYEKKIKLTLVEKELIYPVMIGDVVRTVAWLFEKAATGDFYQTRSCLLEEFKMLIWLIRSRLTFDKMITKYVHNLATIDPLT